MIGAVTAALISRLPEILHAFGFHSQGRGHASDSWIHTVFFHAWGLVMLAYWAVLLTCSLTRSEAGALLAGGVCCGALAYLH